MASSTGSVAGIVLAAGSSRRPEGRDKLYLELTGESLLRRYAIAALVPRGLPGSSHYRAGEPGRTRAPSMERW